MTICNECETVAHCTKHGCIPKVSTKDAMKLALEALELTQDNLRDHGDNCFLHDEGEYNRCFCGKDSLSNHLQSVVEKLDEALAEQPAQQQEPALRCERLECGGSNGCVGHCWKKRKQQHKEPAQQEPVAALESVLCNLSGKCCIEGSDADRAIVDGALAALKAANQEPVAQWQKRHPLRTEGVWENTNEHDAKWWRDKAQGWEIRALYTSPQPPVQREPDLSGLKPSTQEVIKGWIEDGTFIERAIGAMQEQEAENMRLEKMAAPQPAQQEPFGYFRVEPFGWTNCDSTDEGAVALYEHPPAQQEPVYFCDYGYEGWGKVDAAMAAENRACGMTVEAYYTSPPAQRKPLTNLDGLKLAYKHRWLNNLSLRDAYILGIRDAEAAHGIKV